ncbi:unnamed protein product, partial [Polarella glacialis]
VANTFIYVESQEPDAFVARRSASSPPKIFKVISSSKQQQQKEAVHTETNHGGVASAEHVGSESPSRSSIQQQQQQKTQQQKLQAHQRGQCRPCSFQSARADSCRLGDDCQFCHLCTFVEFRMFLLISWLFWFCCCRSFFVFVCCVMCCYCFFVSATCAPLLQSELFVILFVFCFVISVICYL